MEMKSNSYEERIENQIAQYRNVSDIHALPEIFHYWSNKYLRPRLNSVMQTDGVVNFYVNPLAKVCHSQAGTANLISIGAGDCSLEINIAKRLIHIGVTNYELHCLELSPALLERAARAIANDGLQNYVKLHEEDINQWRPTEKYSGIIANHSLHHFVELESIFSGVYECLTDDGVFVTNDMVGRNGHMRWPETLEIVEHIWRFMPDRYKNNRQLDRFESMYINWDCSIEGFEGIRAQDILPLLLGKFDFRSFLASGGITDVFIDRSFGHNLDPGLPADLAFVDFLQLINDKLIDGGIIKPTNIFAVLMKDWPGATDQWRHWSPTFCLRDVSL